MAFRKDTRTPITLEIQTSRLYGTLHDRAEYIAASEAAKEAIWLQRLTADFTDSDPESVSTPTLYCDSQSVIHLVRNPIIYKKTKHVEVRYHHIRELVTKKRLEIRKSS